MADEDPREKTTPMNSDTPVKAADSEPGM